jgi:hypothetical protein
MQDERIRWLAGLPPSNQSRKAKRKNSRKNSRQQISHCSGSSRSGNSDSSDSSSAGSGADEVLATARSEAFSQQILARQQANEEVKKAEEATLDEVARFW